MEIKRKGHKKNNDKGEECEKRMTEKRKIEIIKKKEKIKR